MRGNEIGIIAINLSEYPEYQDWKNGVVATANDAVLGAKENGLIKDFPLTIDINEIDNKLDSAFFAKKLQATVRGAFNKVNPMNDLANAPKGLEALGAMAVASQAARGDAFDMQAFAKALPFDDRIRKIIAVDTELKALFNKVMKQQSMQALLKAQGEYDRSTKYMSSYDKQMNMSVENWISSAYDSSNLLSVTCLCVIHKAISAVMLQENITEEELIASIEFGGEVEIVEVEDPNFKGLMRTVQKFKIDDNAPVLAKRIFENMGLYIGQNTVRYYNYPTTATFKASFSIVKSKELYLPRILIK